MRSEYGQGRVVLAQDALRRGMVDRVATLAETFDRIAAGTPTTRSGSFPASAIDADLDRRRRRANLAALARPLPVVPDDDLARRRQRHALAETVSRTPAI